MMAILNEIWRFLELSAPYLLFGFLVSGLMHELLPKALIKKLLGSGKMSDVFWASLVGVPLPLCSCSVIPMSGELRKSGASNGAVSSFLISTPESGIDSIAVSYSLLDLPMTIFRPVAAFCSAFFAGTLNYYFNSFDYRPEADSKKCCHSNVESHDHGHDHSPESRNVLYRSFHYGLFDLLDDMANWLTFGIIAAGLISYFVPSDFFIGLDNNLEKILILFVGIPLYICASASTPIAASLILKGMSPGTALLFLLVGPATNISNIAVLQKYIGRKGIVFNIFAVTAVALVFSFGVDYFYSHFEMSLSLSKFEEHNHTSLFETLCAFVFLVFLTLSLFRVNVRKKA
jgi:hypothetical protein